MFKKIDYNALNPKAKEIYNYQKVSAVLADYGYTTMWLNNDWEGADFIAVHIDGQTTIKVQLKGRITFDKKYIDKDIFICFIDGGDIYLYYHDFALDEFEQAKNYINAGKGVWSNNKLTKEQKKLMDRWNCLALSSHSDNIWSDMTSFIEKDTNSIKNKDGRVGKIVTRSKFLDEDIKAGEYEAYIISNNTKVYYGNNLSDIVNDGWVF
jgi:hypothetical protein